MKARHDDQYVQRRLCERSRVPGRNVQGHQLLRRSDLRRQRCIAAGRDRPDAGPRGDECAVAVTPTATFSKAVDPASIVFTVKDVTGAAVAGATSYSSDSNVATFTPRAPCAAARCIR